MCIRDRTKAMVTAMDEAGFGNCTNHYECEAACPKGISRDTCLLYTSDAADERSSVDLGGRRIIKKTKLWRHTREHRHSVNITPINAKKCNDTKGDKRDQS